MFVKPFPEIDRRAVPRIGIVPHTSVSGTIKGELINISEKGVCIFSEILLKQKSLHINIALPAKTFSISAQMVWCQKNRDGSGFFYGLKIKNPNNETILSIRKYMVTKQFKYIVQDLENKNDRRLILDFAKEVRNYLFDLNEIKEELKRGKADKDEMLKKITKLSHGIVQEGYNLSNSIRDERLMSQIKECFRMLVSPWVFKSKIMQRGLIKPKGYPGDFETLEIIYDNEAVTEGGLDLGRYFDIAFLNDPYALAVRERKNKMREIIKNTITQGHDEVKILNLACGGCRELRDIFSSWEHDLGGKKLFLYCLDWDKDALSFSEKMLRERPNNVYIEMLEKDILKFIRKPDFYRDKGKQDLIYSIGLADYFSDRILKTMIKNAYEGLKQGGHFVIAHKDKDISFSHVPPEWFCDWVFRPRNERDLLRIIESLNLSSVRIRTDRDKTGDVFFYILTRN